jgi:tetratricopeptide (TPR) repeat protein
MKKIVTLCFIALASTAFCQELTLEEIKTEADHLINNYQFEKALMLLQQGSDSTDVGICNRKGICYSRLGNYPQAIEQFEIILNSDSLNRSILHQLGQLYARNNQYNRAKDCFQTLIHSDSTNSYYYKQYASIAAQVDDFVSATVYYQQAIKLNPRDIESYVSLGNILIEDEQYALADTLLTQGLNYTNHPQVSVLLAKAQFGAEKYEDVIKLVNLMLLRGDTTVVYARLLGISYFQMDQYENVLPCMQFLLNEKVSADWVYYYSGVSLQQTGKPDEAVWYLNKAIDESISDNISTYYTQLASAYEEVKDFKSAIKYYKAAYESSKSDILLYHLARNYDVYYKDKSQAIAYFKKYLSSDDTIKIAKEYTRQRLDQLSNLR